MPTYRLNKLDRAGKYGPGSEQFEASDDYEAMERARVSGHAFACELWLGRRLVGHVIAPPD